MSDTTRIATLEATSADQATYLDTLRSAVSDYGSKFDKIALADLEQKIAPPPNYPGVPDVSSLTMGGEISLPSSTGTLAGSTSPGWAAPTGTATRTTFDTATVTLEQLAQRLAALIEDMAAHGFIGP
jgi:hypothetical protein